MNVKPHTVYSGRQTFPLAVERLLEVRSTLVLDSTFESNVKTGLNVMHHLRSNIINIAWI